jgi:hypothetical protein
MNSFTSLFKGPLRCGVTLIIVGLCTWIACIGYTIRLNPEIRLFVHAAQIKRAWTQQISLRYTNKTVIYGGSSCTFSIDGLHALEKHQFPLVNLGLGAGMGARVLTRFALASTRAGDTLIVSLEPSLLTEDLHPPHLGLQLAAALGELKLASDDDPATPPTAPWLAFPAALRPGGYHVFTLLGKIVRGQAIYRYKPSDFQRDGRQRTTVRMPLEMPSGPGTLTVGGKEFLRSLASYAKEHQIRIAYALPWRYAPLDKALMLQEANLKFLAQVSEFLPVLHDPQLGAYSESSHFADTPWHLDGDGALKRTDEVVREVQAWDVWDRTTLVAASEKKGGVR